MNVTTKQPSPELLSLIKAAAQSLLGFGELWGSIKAKGKDEGFNELDLQDMLRPLLRDRLGMNKDKIYYLFHKEEVKERNSERYKEMSEAYRKKTTFDVEKVIEQSPPTPKEPELRAPENPPQGIEYIETEEDSKDLEISFLKEKVSELEEALKKTQQFTPATEIEPTKSQMNLYTDDGAFQWLADRAKETGDIIYFGRVGSGALVQALAQYKNSFGVVELFGRVVKK